MDVIPTEWHHHRFDRRLLTAHRTNKTYGMCNFYYQLKFLIYFVVSTYKLNDFVFVFFSETTIATARAQVLIYDDYGKKWVPSGSNGVQAVAKVQILQHVQHNTFRLVGRKVQEVLKFCYRWQVSLRYYSWAI